jgi:hypothetical protein
VKLTHVQETDLGSKVCIDGVRVSDEEYTLEIFQRGVNRKAGLLLAFVRNGGTEFEIIIDIDKKIRFERHVYRPHHDHDDRETLQVASGESAGTWIERFPYKGEGREFLCVDFGAVEVEY